MGHAAHLPILTPDSKRQAVSPHDPSRKLVQSSPEDGRSYQTVRDEWTSLLRQYGSQLDVVSRYVGGVQVDRAVVGQPGATRPLTPAARAEQERALDVLHRYAFAPDAFVANAELFAHLQLQRRGWDFGTEGEDPKLLGEFLTVQGKVLDHLLHVHTVTRILNSRLYGNAYPLDEVIDDLTAAIFQVGAAMEAQPSPQRQGLQRSYIDRLIGIAGLEADSSYPQPAQALAFSELKSLESRLDILLSPHPQHLAWIIRKALDEER